MRLSCRVLLSFLCLFLVQSAIAQTNPTGTISGRVVDQQGLALPGVSVTASSPALQGNRTTTTSQNGDFILPFLPPGDYTIDFELTASPASSAPSAWPSARPSTSPKRSPSRR